MGRLPVGGPLCSFSNFHVGKRTEITFKQIHHGSWAMIGLDRSHRHGNGALRVQSHHLWLSGLQDMEEWVRDLELVLDL